MVSDSTYQDHEVFGVLERYIAFYDRLAQTVFLWVPSGTSALCNIDSYLFSSVAGTLQSIQAILREGRINDAYVLLRKYCDSAYINIYTILYLDDHFGIDNFIVEQIDNWLKGKDRLPDFRIMSQYIRASNQVAALTNILFVDDRYKRIRERCNDHTHYNFYHNLLLNDNQLYLTNRSRALSQFYSDLRDIFVFHFAYLFSSRQNYMMSSDHVDALECGMTPETDSQYWVAPFVQDAFDDLVKPTRPDVAALMKRQTSMHLD